MTVIIIILSLITVGFMTWCLLLSTENDKLRNQSETDSHIISKNLLRIIDISIDVEMLTEQVNQLRFNHKACHQCRKYYVDREKELLSENKILDEMLKDEMMLAANRKEINKALFAEIKRLMTNEQKRDNKGRFTFKNLKPTQSC